MLDIVSYTGTILYLRPCIVCPLALLCTSYRVPAILVLAEDSEPSAAGDCFEAHQDCHREVQPARQMEIPAAAGEGEGQRTSQCSIMYPHIVAGFFSILSSSLLSFFSLSFVLFLVSFLLSP